MKFSCPSQLSFVTIFFIALEGEERSRIFDDFAACARSRSCSIRGRWL
ncbi:unnamed protein product [Amoebophrya sp. A120]|nr:unnamed protein product [Amoebophrya sp. A120]|eukprot:GSA120T00023907001.1